MIKLTKLQINDLSQVREYRQGFRRHWNNGVIATFQSIEAFPSTAAGYMGQAKDFIAESMEGGQQEQQPPPAEQPKKE